MSGWLDRLFARAFSVARRPSADDLAPGDEVRSGSDVWRVTAVLVCRAGAEEWPSLQLVRGGETMWVGLERDGAVRYDPLPGVEVDADGRARWEGRLYTQTEAGSGIVTRPTGAVEAAPGDRFHYQTLTSPGVDDRWISVERWEGSTTEVSAARPWRIDRIARPGGR